MALIKIGLIFTVICRKDYRFIIRKNIKSISPTKEAWINSSGNLLINKYCFIGIDGCVLFD